MQPKPTLTLAKFAEQCMHPLFISASRKLMSDLAGFEVTTLVWFNGRYRAMPSETKEEPR